MSISELKKTGKNFNKKSVIKKTFNSENKHHSSQDNKTNLQMSGLSEEGTPSAVGSKSPVNALTGKEQELKAEADKCNNNTPSCIKLQDHPECVFYSPKEVLEAVKEAKAEMECIGCGKTPTLCDECHQEMASACMEDVAERTKAEMSELLKQKNDTIVDLGIELEDCKKRFSDAIDKQIKAWKEERERAIAAKTSTGDQSSFMITMFLFQLGKLKLASEDETK